MMIRLEWGCTCGLPLHVYWISPITSGIDLLMVSHKEKQKRGI